MPPRSPSSGWAAAARRRPAKAARRLGVMVPWANRVVETELPAWADGRVAWHYARLTPPTGGTALSDDFLTGLLDAVPGALHQLSELPLDRVYLACTSVAFTQQYAVKEASAGCRVPVVTAFEAILAALARCGARAIALATPYPEGVTAIEVEAFEAAGIRVAGAACLDLADGYGDVTTAQIRALVDRLPARDLADVDAVVLSCTGWPTQTVLHRLRRRITCPMISSNLAICMDAMRNPT